MSTLKVNNIQDADGNNPSTAAQLNKGRAKAWVNFNGGFQDSNNEFTLSNGGLRTSYNVSSVTDRGTSSSQQGLFTVNFNSGTFTSVNFIAAGITGNYNGITTNAFVIIPDGTRTVTAFPIRVYGAGDPSDKGDINLVFFGD
tara:strand:- start:7 stop:432 length:426 start_codon:yes stop_codon:yes gene_type:complete